ncbi:conserved domain protein [Peptoniphilus harei ACS-146-V-Sch2b]|uniref:Conserved domain protein n=1 Tax=Peptoniphilus harei ACS-146-V-Sch2b TaxID=908338 RepID=E4L157_9FIRM|nr:hypothetical protein [Peptoniphilus harei]EFR32223.1 conserved domain protein [Peptoniphilus harei ACS-146-V-Sch2b]
MSDLTIYFLVTVFISALETFTYIREDKKGEKDSKNDIIYSFLVSNFFNLTILLYNLSKYWICNYG